MNMRTSSQRQPAHPPHAPGTQIHNIEMRRARAQMVRSAAPARSHGKDGTDRLPSGEIRRVHLMPCNPARCRTATLADLNGVTVVDAGWVVAATAVTAR